MRVDWKEDRKGFKTERKWEGVPNMWAIGRKRAWAKGREFEARGVQAERVRGIANRAGGNIEVE